MTDIRNLRKISDEQAKKEIIKYLNHVHARCYDPYDIQIDLNISILQAITILEKLVQDGKIKRKEIIKIQTAP